MGPDRKQAERNGKSMKEQAWVAKAREFCKAQDVTLEWVLERLLGELCEHLTRKEAQELGGYAYAGLNGTQGKIVAYFVDHEDKPGVVSFIDHYTLVAMKQGAPKEEISEFRLKAAALSQLPMLSLWNTEQVPPQHMVMFSKNDHISIVMYGLGEDISNWIKLVCSRLSCEEWELLLDCKNYAENKAKILECLKDAFYLGLEKEEVGA